MLWILEDEEGVIWNEGVAREALEIDLTLPTPIFLLGKRGNIFIYIGIITYISCIYTYYFSPIARLFLQAAFGFVRCLRS
jgi:hypothetical protein